jgi:hypothetical protein
MKQARSPNNSGARLHYIRLNPSNTKAVPAGTFAL